MDDFARRNLRDFLTMYNQFTEICFHHCIQNFNHRNLFQEEDTCTKQCAEKLINVNHRLIATYMEINPLHKQTAALEAAASARAQQEGSEMVTPPPPPEQQPSNLANQVQEVFGLENVVTGDTVTPVVSEER